MRLDSFFCWWVCVIDVFVVVSGTAVVMGVAVMVPKVVGSREVERSASISVVCEIGCALWRSSRTKSNSMSVQNRARSSLLG